MFPNFQLENNNTLPIIIIRLRHIVNKIFCTEAVIELVKQDTKRKYFYNS